jgi:peptide/nickel transport system substrate-binding protein
MKLRRPLGVAAACVLVCLSVAVAASARLDATNAKPTLTIGLNGDPGSLDPAKSGNGENLLIMMLSHAAIVRLNPDGTYSPDLATKFHYVGQGNKLYEFTLRHNARFSDGTQVTAQAVKSWLEYFNNANGPLKSDIGVLKSIETVGKWTVRIHLRSPNPIMPMVLSSILNWGSISSPKAVANPSTLGTTTAGAGPYVLVPSQTVAGNHYTFVPNKYYYNPAGIKFSKVIVKIISNPSSMLDALKTGQVDVANGNSTTGDAAKAAGFDVSHSGVGFLGIHLMDRAGKITKALGDVRVRQALNYAVNREAIRKAIYGNYASATSEATTLDGFDPKYQNHFPYNPTKAKQLLAAAGYPNGFEFDLLDLNAGPLVNAMAQNFSAVGVKMNITTPASIGDYLSKLASKTYAATSLTYGSQPMWLMYESTLKPGALLNPYGADDPTLDKLWLKGQRNPSATPQWLAMSDRFTDQAWFIPAVKYDGLFYSSKKIGGVQETEKGFIPNPVVWYPK